MRSSRILVGDRSEGERGAAVEGAPSWRLFHHPRWPRHPHAGAPRAPPRLLNAGRAAAAGAARRHFGPFFLAQGAAWHGPPRRTSVAVRAARAAAARAPRALAPGVLGSSIRALHVLLHFRPLGLTLFSGIGR